MSHGISPFYTFLGFVALELAALYLMAWAICRLVAFLACKTQGIQMTMGLRKKLRWVTPAFWLVLIVVMYLATKSGASS